MAAPGLGYVKRDVEKTTVDWGAVSGGLTTALGGAFAAGEKQKAGVAIADQTMAGEFKNFQKELLQTKVNIFHPLFKILVMPIKLLKSNMIMVRLALLNIKLQ